MFKEFGFWVSVLGFGIVWFFAHDLELENYLGLMVGCIVIANAYSVGKFLGDK